VLDDRKPNPPEFSGVAGDLSEPAMPFTGDKPSTGHTTRSFRTKAEPRSGLEEHPTSWFPGARVPDDKKPNPPEFSGVAEDLYEPTMPFTGDRPSTRHTTRSFRTKALGFGSFRTQRSILFFLSLFFLFRPLTWALSQAQTQEALHKPC
jgi:hypothetical protein